MHLYPNLNPLFNTRKFQIGPKESSPTGTNFAHYQIPAKEVAKLLGKSILLVGRFFCKYTKSKVELVSGG